MTVVHEMNVSRLAMRQECCAEAVSKFFEDPLSTMGPTKPNSSSTAEIAL